MVDKILQYDPAIYHAIVAEEKRQQDNIELIASENIVSATCRAAMGTILTNKYAEGYPSKRYYGGCQFVDIVENAERFGLAQLHQLRGRVGRGDAQSYCIMINTSKSKNSKKRLEILNHSNDGFFIASEDLKLRGPGDFFGIRQSGDLAFQLGDIYQDAAVLQKASDTVKEILSKDPELESDEYKILKKQMNYFLSEQLKKMNL